MSRPALLACGLALLLAAPARASLAIHVDGRHLVDARGRVVRLLGVNFSGAEYACAQGYGIWDAPHDRQAVAAMRSWHVRAVRVPLNEHCWLGMPDVKAAYRGARYRRAIHAYVLELHRAGMRAILDLHWNAPRGQRALGQQRMADIELAPRFWRSVSRSFRGDRAVLFDLYNEPHDISWRCWRDGCRGFAGMRRLLRAVRSTGSRNVVLLGGLAYANDLSRWLRFRPRDPPGQQAAAFHLYNFNACADRACWDRTVARVARRVPLVTGELGEDDCSHDFIDGYMDWADAHGVSFLGWTWNAWDCRSGPALIASPDGTPTAFGRGLRDRLRALRR